MNLLKTFLSKIGLDKSIAYSSSARIIQGVAGVGTIFFIATFLSGVEQGFYFTFGSIHALQVFFELGLTGIMTQYVAHEVSHLSITADGTISGNDVYKSRLSSLLHFCVKWYTYMALFVFVFLTIVGYVYFTKFGDTQTTEVQWKIPWLLISVATGLQLFISPLTSFLTGLGYVKETSKITFYQQLITPLAMWISLACGFKLYVTGIAYLMSILVWIILVKRQSLLNILLCVWNTEIEERVSYMKEIFPYQWRIALSWVSGYFIFQLFNPVLFATEGAIVAGQMGMTLQALNAISALSMSWLNTKIPMYSKLIATKCYEQLDAIFNKTLKQMTIVCGFLLVLFLAFIIVLRVLGISINGSNLGERFLPLVPMLFMIIPIFLQQFTNSWATYLRCHKREPFLIISLTGGILCLSSTLIFGYKFGLYGVTIGYLIIQLTLFPWGYNIYRTKKYMWHEKEI